MLGQYATYPSLKDRTVLIYGGAEGIGASLVEAFVLQGSKVIFLDISDIAANALDIESLQTTANAILAKYGRVDVLVNCAAKDTRRPTAAVTPGSWDHDVAVNLRHIFFLTQIVVPHMQEAKSGSIINFGSIAWAIPATGLPVYSTCKAAILGLTRSHAHEYGKDGIRINSVVPGAIATERQKREIITPEYEAEIIRNQALKRSLGPDEVARLVLFLAADDSSAITNQSHIVDGGWV